MRATVEKHPGSFYQLHLYLFSTNVLIMFFLSHERAYIVSLHNIFAISIVVDNNQLYCLLFIIKTVYYLLFIITTVFILFGIKCKNTTRACNGVFVCCVHSSMTKYLHNILLFILYSAVKRSTTHMLIA